MGGPLLSIDLLSRGCKGDWLSDLFLPGVPKNQGVVSLFVFPAYPVP